MRYFRYRLVIKGNLFDGEAACTQYLPVGSRLINVRDDGGTTDCVINVISERNLITELNTWFTKHVKPPYPKGALLYYTEVTEL